MYYLGFFIGAVLIIWLLSVFFTFIQKLVTKRVTRKVAIAAIIIAGIICFIGALFGEWEPGRAQMAYIAIIIGTLIVTWARLNSLKKKQEKMQIVEKKKQEPSE